MADRFREVDNGKAVFGLANPRAEWTEKQPIPVAECSFVQVKRGKITTYDNQAVERPGSELV
jgi:hypothetical protein